MYIYLGGMADCVWMEVEVGDRWPTVIINAVLINGKSQLLILLNLLLLFTLILFEKQKVILFILTLKIGQIVGGHS